MNNIPRRMSWACAALAVTIMTLSAGAPSANAASLIRLGGVDRCSSLRVELAYLQQEYKTNPSPHLQGEIRTIENELDQLC